MFFNIIEHTRTYKRVRAFYALTRFFSFGEIRGNMRQKYHSGMYINGIYLKEYLYQGKGNIHKGLFICPYCNEEFITRLSAVASGKTTSCGCKRLDALEGQRFGKLTVIKKEGHQNGRVAWLCQCDCGNTIIAQGKLLKNGNVKSCGCLKNIGHNKKDLAGKRFGYLTVISEEGRVRPYPTACHVVWKCQCDCGNTIYVPSNMLLNGKTYSCGCKKHRSHGENKVMTLLLEHNVSFEEQKTFDDLINPLTNHKLRFDFYLTKENIVIEYDGKQHNPAFKPHGFFNEERLKDLYFRDEVKNNYCKTHNITLIRIPSDDYHKLNWEYLTSRLPQLSTI